MIRAKYPWAGLAAIGVIVVLEVLFLANTEPLTGRPFLQPTADDAAVLVKRRMLAESKGGTVLIGDSSCTMGLIPDLIEREIGDPVINLGTLATHTTVGYCGLGKQSLTCKPKTDRVVLVILPQALEMTREKATQYGLLGRTLVAYPEMRHPIYIAGVADWRDWFFLKHRLNRFPPAFGGSYNAYLERIRQQLGFYEEAHKYAGAVRVHERFSIEAFALAPIESLCRDAKDHKIPVYIWFSPSPKDALSESCQAGLTQWMAEVKSRLPEVHWLQTEVPVWEPRYFSSQTHLNRAGAERNSELLAQALQGVGERE